MLKIPKEWSAQAEMKRKELYVNGALHPVQPFLLEAASDWKEGVEGK